MALRFGVLGTGYWALETHASMLAAADDAELVAIWGRDPAKTEAAAARFGIAGYSDLDRLLAEVDAVAIAVPPDVQAELAYGRPPPGATCCSTSRWPCRWTAPTGWPRRSRTPGWPRWSSHPAVPARPGRLGRAGRRRRRLAGRRRGLAGDGVHRARQPLRRSPWRRAKGALWDLGPHVLSLALPVLGPVQRVTAATGHGDTVHLVLGHAGGASSTLTLSQTVPVAAAHIGLQVLGPGPLGRPPLELAHPDAMGEAIRQLRPWSPPGDRPPLRRRLGRDTVAVLEAAERFLAAAPETRAAGVAG